MIKSRTFTEDECLAFLIGEKTETIKNILTTDWYNPILLKRRLKHSTTQQKGQ